MMIRVLLASLVLATALPAQMEKRSHRGFKITAFNKAWPALGSEAPDLAFADLDGRVWSLKKLRGKTVCLIGAGFT